MRKERINLLPQRETPTRPCYRNCYPERRPKQRQLDSKLYSGDFMTAADKKKFITLDEWRAYDSKDNPFQPMEHLSLPSIRMYLEEGLR